MNLKSKKAFKIDDFIIALAGNYMLLYVLSRYYMFLLQKMSLIPLKKSFRHMTFVLIL